jgi:hypothetical protein
VAGREGSRRGVTEGIPVPPHREVPRRGDQWTRGAGERAIRTRIDVWKVAVPADRLRQSQDEGRRGDLIPIGGTHSEAAPSNEGFSACPLEAFGEPYRLQPLRNEPFFVRRKNQFGRTSVRLGAPDSGHCCASVERLNCFSNRRVDDG